MTKPIEEFTEKYRDYEDIVVERLRKGGTAAVAKYIYDLKEFNVKLARQKEKKEVLDEILKVAEFVEDNDGVDLTYLKNQIRSSY